MVFHIWKRNAVQFTRTWLISLFWIVIEPTLILGAMGFGLGSYITTINGVTYADFFFPAILCTSAMFVTYFVSTYDNFSKLTHQKTFVTQILTAIEPKEVVIGEILWASTKGTISAIGVAIVGAAIGLVDTWRIFPVFFIVFLSCMVFAAFGVIVTTYIRNFDQIIYPSSGLIIPMSLFSDTYFPVETLPHGLKYVTYIFPLTNAVSASRTILQNGFSDYTLIVKVLYLAILAFLLIRFAITRLSQRLLD
jgi:lipooligosaccharide transport system permease protein